MGGLIEYTRTNFVAPDPIEEATYLSLKNSLNKDPFFNIVQNESIREKYSRYIRFMYIGAIGIAISLLLGWIFKIKADGFLLFLIVPSGLLLFGSIILFLLETPSYSQYLEKSEAYFLRMKYAVQKSSSFFEFNEIFYSIYSSDYDSDFKRWKKQYLKDIKLNKKRLQLNKK
jgi:hypothetical protein